MSSNIDKSRIEVLIARSADLTNKPFIHSVVKLGGENIILDKELDFTAHVICRDKDGLRVEKFDLELEIFDSNSSLVIVIARLNFPNDPILWYGNKILWMNSKTGDKCNPPAYSSNLENLAIRIKTFFDKKYL